MTVPTLAERIGASFSAWELRGRGWQLAAYPVSLEPPFRPFFVLPLPASPIASLDDGRRPTFLSTLYERAQRALAGETAAPTTLAPAYEEQEPFSAIERGPLVTRRILVPKEFDTRPEVMAQLLAALATGFHPVSFEIVGHEGKVSIQVACADIDAEHVFARINDYIPDASVIPDEDVLAEAWRNTGAPLIADFGYADEFFLPLASGRALRTDPYIPLVTALARAKDGEALCFQVLFERAQNPWRSAILHAVAPDGSALFVDAPEFVPSAKEKTASPLFACALRLAASAHSPERARDLIRGTHAFIAQFTRPGGNALIPLSNDGYPDDLHEEALLNRQSYRTGMIVSLDELLGFVHMPDASVQNGALVRAERRTKALPAVAEGHPCVIGENAHRGTRTEATLGVTERLQHTLITGASGTGKSTLLVNMIRQDLEQGHGCAVLDPHGDLIDEILSSIPRNRLSDVVLFDPADEAWPVGFNILGASSELEKNLLASDLVGIFQRFSTSWGDSMSTVLSNAVLAILESPTGGTLIHLRRFLVDDTYRKHFLSTVSNTEVQFFWTKEWPLIGARSIGPILTRLNTFLRPKLLRHIVGQEHPKLQLGTVMNERKVFLAKLSQGLIGNENAYVLGSLVLSKFLQLALSRQRLAKDERKPFFIYLDEAEHFITPSVAALFTEARKYGVGITAACQALSQLRSLPQVEHAILGNAHTRIVFRVSDDDARKLADGYSFFDDSDLKNLGRGEAIVRMGEARNDFNIRTIVRSRSDNESAYAAPDEVVEGSRQRFALPIAEVATDLGTLRSSIEVPPTEMGGGAEIPPAAQPRTEPEPTNEIPAHEQPRSSRARHRAPEPVARPLGRGGQEHKYLQQLIKRLGEERGFRATIEDAVAGGRSDVSLRRADVAIACEVSVTTDAEHEIANVRKCLSGDFTHVWLLVADKKRQSKLTSEISNLNLGPRVRCLSVEELVPTLDAIAPVSSTTTRTAGGYKVKVTRRVVSYEDVQQRTSAVASVIAKSLLKSRKEA